MVVALVVIAASSLQANLGDTEADLKARYGEPNAIERDGRALRVFSYQANGYKIRVGLVDGKSQHERYRPVDEARSMTDEEIQGLLNANAGGKQWKIMPDGRLALGDETAAPTTAFILPERKELNLGTAVYDHAFDDFLRPDPTVGQQETFTGVASFQHLREPPGDLLLIRTRDNVLVISWPSKSYPELAHITEGETYRITVVNKEADDTGTAMVFISDREHKTWPDVVDDSKAEPLVRIEEGKQTIFDRAVCEVHHIKMPLIKAEIVYGMYAPTEVEGFCHTHLPHYRTFALGGCVMSDVSPKTTAIYLCPACVAECEKHKYLTEGKALLNWLRQ